jgi:hypothetical protein
MRGSVLKSRIIWEFVEASDFEGGVAVGVAVDIVGGFSGQAFELAGASGEVSRSRRWSGSAVFGGGDALVADEVLVAVCDRARANAASAGRGALFSTG